MDESMPSGSWMGRGRGCRIEGDIILYAYCFNTFHRTDMETYRLGTIERAILTGVVLGRVDGGS